MSFLETLGGASWVTRFLTGFNFKLLGFFPSSNGTFSLKSGMTGMVLGFILKKKE